MKILRLDLRAFGPFTGLALDFPADGAGLHLILGPNEAGKSSTLRALRHLLFGFTPRIADDFRHEAKRLRVGATLQGEDGTDLVVVRRRGNAKTLRGEDDESVVDPASLARLLGGVDEDQFKAYYSTDLDELKQGGRNVLEGKGDLGAILFGGAGLAGMPQVLRELRKEYEDLYKPRASNPPINKALAALKESRREVIASQLSGDRYHAARADRDEAARRRDAAKADRDRLDAEHRRLTRLDGARPALAHRDAARAGLAALGPTPTLPDDFAARQIAAVTTRDASSRQAEALRPVVADLEARLAAATASVPEPLLAVAEAIGTLREGMDSHRKGREARAGLLHRIEQGEAATHDLAHALGPIGDGPARLGKPGRDTIKKLSRDYYTYEKSVESATLTLAICRAKYEAQPLGLPIDEAAGPLNDLARTIARIQGMGDLDDAAKAARAKAARHRTKADADLARLSPWSGTLDALRVAPVPPAESVARAEASIDRARAAVTAVEDERGTLDHEVAGIDQSLEELRLTDEPPTTDDLDRARAARDRGWIRVRRTWLDGEPAKGVPSGALAAEYERAVSAADATADRLRREADRVARRAGLAARRESLAAKLAAIPGRLSETVARLAGAEADWRDAWRPAGVEPRSPAEMRGWLEKHKELLNQAETIADAAAEADRADDRRSAAVADLRAALEALGEPAPAAGSLAAWLARAESAADRGRLGRDLIEARREADEATALLVTWRARWAPAVSPIGLGPGATPAEADEAIEKADALLKRADGLAADREALARIADEADRFRREVVDLARRVGRDPGHSPPEALLDALRRDLDDARESLRIRDALAQDLAARRESLRLAEETVAHQSAVLDELRRLAGCDSADDLPAAIEASARAGEFRRRIAAEDDRLAELAGGGSVEDLAEEAAGLDPDTLPARLRDLAEAVAARGAGVEALAQEFGEREQALKQMTGDSKASDANERAEQWLVAIESDVEHYARVRLAEAVLRKAIDVYREKHQGPVLGRASALFSALTSGSFAGLRLVDPDDEDPRPDGRPVLMGIRNRGGTGAEECVRVEGMSEGTANALFLSVRLATLEVHLDAHPPLPFVVDDILVQFDDRRASAALGILERLSRKTQVFFFTHHDHLIDLARSSLPADSWRLHTLPGPSSA